MDWMQIVRPVRSEHQRSLSDYGRRLDANQNEAATFSLQTWCPENRHLEGDEPAFYLHQ